MLCVWSEERRNSLCTHSVLKIMQIGCKWQNLLIVNGRFFNFLVCIYITSQSSHSNQLDLISEFISLELRGKKIWKCRKGSSELGNFHKFDLHLGFSSQNLTMIRGNISWFPRELSRRTLKDFRINLDFKVWGLLNNGLLSVFDNNYMM